MLALKYALYFTTVEFRAEPTWWNDAPHYYGDSDYDKELIIVHQILTASIGRSVYDNSKKTTTHA
jgi:hypothetical protein